MWRHRLKDQIEWKGRSSSPFAALINILLVLMACFAVFAALGDRNFIEQNLPGCTLDLWCCCPPELIVVTASTDHTYYWNNQGPYPIDKFPSQLGDWKKNVQTPQVLIAGDRTARFGDTIRMIDELQRQGIERYTVESRTRAKPSVTR